MSYSHSDHTFDIVALTALAGGLNAISSVLSELFGRHGIINNEKLETINMELRQRTDELNTFLQAMLSSLRAGVVVVDHKDKILVWNLKARTFGGYAPTNRMDNPLSARSHLN